MKKIIIPVLSIVLLMNVSKTFAQASQTTSDLSKSAITNAQTTTPGKQAQGKPLARKANPNAPVTTAAAIAKPVPHKPQMNAVQIQERETKIAQDMGNAFAAKLSLTASQHEAVNVACLNYVEATDEQRTGLFISNETNAKYMAELNADIQVILSAEQKETLQALRKVKGTESLKN